MKSKTPFAARLRALMARAGVDAPRLCLLSGLSRQVVHKLLAGSVPSWPTVVKLADALGLPADAFR